MTWTVLPGGRSGAPPANDSASPELAKRLIRARELAGLTVAQAAKLAGWPRSMILGLESGRAARHNYDLHRELAHLAKIYGVALAWLQGEAMELPTATKRLLDDIACPRDRETVRELLTAIRGVPAEGDTDGEP